MKWMILIFAMISASANCEDELSKVINELNKEKADFIAEKIIDSRWGDNKIRTAPTKEKKPKKEKKLKECIKPNNLIDDEVKRCMDGK